MKHPVLKVMRLRMVCLLFAGLLGLMPSLAIAVEVFGSIELVEGSVSIVDPQGQTRIPLANDKLMEGDTVVTGRDGEIHIRTEDQGFVAVRPATKFRVDTYLAHGDANDKSVTSLLVGTVRSITGWIGKYHPDAYTIKTPSATIGVRGTDHEPNVILAPEPGQTAIGEPGTYDKVNQGSTVIRSDKGQVEVKPNQAGFAGITGSEAPRTLASVPSFYKASKNEGRIERRKENLSQNMEQHRASRIKQTASKAGRTAQLKTAPQKVPRPAQPQHGGAAAEHKR